MLPLTLSVGVTGHRFLAPEHLNRITKQVRKTLEVIKSEARYIIAKHPELFVQDPTLRIVSCLSEGADRLVAEQGLDLSYELEAILPFPRNSPVHARDLTGQAQTASRNELHMLLSKAKNVLELAPEYVGESSLVTTKATAQRQYAYEEAGRFMLEHSDILIAIWHGDPQLAPGSSEAMMREALKSHMIVIWVHAEEDASPCIYTNDGYVPCGCTPLTKEYTLLRLMLEKRFAPPTVDSANKILAPELQECLSELKANTLPPKPFWFLWWGHFFSWIAPATKSAPDMATLSRVEDPTYKCFSSLAEYYGMMHRSFFLLASLLGVCAVIVAACSLAIDIIAIKLLLGIVELFLLGFLWRTHVTSQRNAWQRKFTDYRLITEHLRHASFARGVGLVVDGLPKLAYYTPAPSDWVDWLIRLHIRQEGLPPISFEDEEYVKEQKGILSTAWLDEQAQYQKVNADRTSNAEHRLHSYCERFFMTTLFLVIVHLVSKCFVLPIFFKGIFCIVGILTVVLPPIAMALHAIGQYAEFRRLHNRSSNMYEALSTFHEQMGKQTSPSGIIRVTRHAAEFMIGESVEWRVQYTMPKVTKV